MSRSSQVLNFLHAAHLRGERTVLVAIADIFGSASRARGSLMAVAEHGAWCGSLSGGCVEAAVVGEAQRVLATGKAELVRLGKGSPMIDIRLPCGGGLDLLMVPEPDPAAVEQAVALLELRQPASLSLERTGLVGTAPATPGTSTKWDGAVLQVRCDPALRLLAIGHGEETVALARLGVSFGADTLVVTPDAEIGQRSIGCGADLTLLKTPADCQALVSDDHTAAVLLFHDHDWEIEPLRHLLGQPGFFIGAMGSPRTQAQRLAALRDAGIGEQALKRLVGPVGLIPSTRDPDMLALSILAHVAAAWTEVAATGFAPDLVGAASSACDDTD